MYNQQEIKFQVIKDILSSGLVFNKSALDFRILVFNEKFKSIFTKYKTIGERVRNFKEIFDLIRSYLGVSDVEKKLKGEVFTPFELIEEMLNTLPKEFWENKNQKILEPANGIGNFVAVLLYRFMFGFKHPNGWETKGLSEQFLDEEERYNWIMEEIIHVIDIQPKNMFIYREIFDPEHKLNLKYYTDSFLNENIFIKYMYKWNINKFTLICGNPPYNDSEGIKGGCKNLYQPFIIKSLDYYNKYLLFVTPPGFYKTTNFDEPNAIFKKITTDNSLIYLNNSDIQNKYFNVGSLIVYFLIKKEKYTITKIENEKGIFNIDISKFNFIPRVVNNETYSILEKISLKGERLDVFRDDKMKITVDKFITLSTLNHLNSKGYWNTNVGNDENRARIVIRHKNPELLKYILDLKLYRFIFYIYRHDGAVYHNFIKGFRIPSELKYYSDFELYKYFNLTDDEIKLIEDTIK